MPASSASIVGRILGGNPYTAIGWWDLFNRTIDAIESTLPKWVHGIQVAVVGGPKSHIRRLWYLCLSAAFGRYRERVTTAVSGFSLQANWDISNKTVSVELVYQDNGWGQAVGQLAGGGLTLNAPSQSALGRIARGPEQLTVGGSWPVDLASLAPLTTVSQPTPSWVAYKVCPTATFSLFATTILYTTIGGRRDIGTGIVGTGVSATAPVSNVLQEYPWSNGTNGEGFFTALSYAWFGIGSLPANGQQWAVLAPDGLDNACRVFSVLGGEALPTLPDDGRVITTVEQNDPNVQPPRPIIDGHTRSGLLSLVAQSLSSPCYLPISPPCTLTPAASSGRYVYQPGAFQGPVPVQQQTIASAMAGANGTFVQPNIGPDGYPTEPMGPSAPNVGQAPNFGQSP